MLRQECKELEALPFSPPLLSPPLPSLPSPPSSHVHSGTYCHQREVEAITESIVESSGFLCCDCRNIPGVMSFNSAMNQRWSTWEVMSSCYVLKGYGIVENHLSHLFNAYEYRWGYLTYLVQVCVRACVGACACVLAYVHVCVHVQLFSQSLFTPAKAPLLRDSSIDRRYLNANMPY